MFQINKDINFMDQLPNVRRWMSFSCAGNHFLLPTKKNNEDLDHSFASFVNFPKQTVEIKSLEIKRIANAIRYIRATT